MPGNHGSKFKKNLVQPEYLCSLTKEGKNCVKFSLNAVRTKITAFGSSLLLGHYFLLVGKRSEPSITDHVSLNGKFWVYRIYV